jgi:hypothetical protein
MQTVDQSRASGITDIVSAPPPAPSPLPVLWPVLTGSGVRAPPPTPITQQQPLAGYVITVDSDAGSLTELPSYSIAVELREWELNSAAEGNARGGDLE